MSIRAQVIILLFAFLLLVVVLELLRRRKISEGTMLWWLFILLAIIFLTLNQPLLGFITTLMGIGLPVSALVLMSLSFILLMLIYFSVKISVISSQLKDIAQYLSIFKAEYDGIKQKHEKT